MAKEMVTQAEELQSLRESGLEVVNKQDDVRGRRVYDKDGNHIGNVEDLIVDTSENKVRFLRIGQGGFLGIGEKHYLIPVDAITDVNDEGVMLGSQHGQVSGAPDYDPDLASKDRQRYWSGVYDYWGYPPYWTPGYVYPGYPVYGGPVGVRRGRGDIPSD